MKGLISISIKNNRLAAERIRENGTPAQKADRARKDKDNKKRLARKLRAIAKRNVEGSSCDSGGGGRGPPPSGDGASSAIRA